MGPEELRMDLVSAAVGLVGLVGLSLFIVLERYRSSKKNPRTD